MSIIIVVVVVVIIIIISGELTIIAGEFH